MLKLNEFFCTSVQDRRQRVRHGAEAVFVLILSALFLAGTPYANAADMSPTEQATEGADNAQCPADGEGRKCGDGSPDPGEVPLGNLPNLLGGNPINILSGNKHQREVDFSIPGGELTLQRAYNSQNADNNVGLGQGWHHTFAVSLFDAGSGRLEIVQSSGSRLYFSANGVDGSGYPLMRGTFPNEGYLVKRGRYHEWHLPDGRMLRFRGRYLVRIDLPGQQRLDLFYKGGRVAHVSDGTGRVMRFDYHEGKSQLPGYEISRFGVVAGHLSRVTLPDGSKIEYDYDQNRNLTRARFSDDTAREYHYEDDVYPNHLTGITDRTGIRSSTWRYDETGRAVSSEHANAFQRLDIRYPELQSVEAGETVSTELINSLGQQSRYTWRKPRGRSRPQLMSSDGVACSTCPETGFSYSYDQQGRLLNKTRTGQGTAVGVGDTRYVYDAQGRISEIWHSDEFSQEQLSERLEYEGLSLLPVRRYTPSVNPAGMQVTETERNAQGLPHRIVEQGFAPQLDTSGIITSYSPIERVTRFTYDEGRLVSADGPRDDVDDTTRFIWDSQNRMTSIALPDSPPMRITEFDVLGRAVRFVRGFSTGRSASPVSVSYNQASQITSVTQSGRTLSLRYDEEGRLSGMVNRVGREMQLGYDASGQLLSIEFVGGQRYTQDYDEEGRVIGESLMDQYGEMIRSLSKLYDAQGRVASVTRDITIAGTVGANSTTIAYDYDVHNRPVQATQRARAGSVELEYTALGELAGITGPVGTGIALGYDAAGNPSSLRDTRDNTTQFIQDDFDRVVAAVSADAGTSRYSYDAAGNRTLWTNPAGDTTSYTWDAADRPLLISSRDGDTRFTYDRDTGLLAQTSNSATTERFEYDRDARLLRHERLIDERSFVTEYRYDEQGRMLSRQLPDGQSLRYHYYEGGALVGQLRAITRSTLFGLQQEVLLAEIDEDPSDGITGFISHNGKRTTRTHASDGRVTRIEISDTVTLGYRYDGLGRIIGIDENGITQSFAYNQGYLSAASTLTGSYVFNYDESGNRTGESVRHPDGQRTQMGYQFAQAGVGNRLLVENELSSQSVSTLSYNSSGSPVARGKLRYEYNNDQRPLRIYKDGALLAEYAYNSFGERIRKVTYRGDQKRIIYFLYDGHQLSAEIEVDDVASNGSMAQTIYLQDRPVVQLLGQGVYAVHTDRLGTAHMLSDEAGAIAWQAEYSPFGKATILIDDVVFKHRLPGQYEDVETGTHYNYMRDYDPETGRYLTSDPLSIGGGLNTYLYANADPLNSVDVLGLKPDLSGFDGQPGTHIDASDYDKLHGYAMAGNGVKYFETLFELTGHGLYKDFADSYSQTFTPTAIYILREIFMRHGMNNIAQVACLPDRSPVYQIEEMDLFSESVFQAAGIGRGVGTFVMDGATGIWNLGVGTVNLVLDSSIGAYGDLLRNYFGEDSLPAWYPSYADAVDTVSTGLEIGQMIYDHPELIWEGLTEDVVRLWAEGRYAQSITQGGLELGSMFVGVGAAVKVARLAELLKVLKRVDAGDAGAFNKGLDELIDEFGDDPDLLRKAADEAGLLDEVNAHIATRPLVYDSITPTEAVRSGTSIPRSFEIETDGGRFWVHPNATKHMEEYVTRNGTTQSTSIDSQVMLSSFQEAINHAVQQGIRNDEMMIIDGWEIIFTSGRPGDVLPVIKHALYRP